MKIEIFYPSGHTLHLSGEWVGPLDIEGLSCLMIKLDRDCIVPGGQRLEKGAAFLGDPRGVYRDEGGGHTLFTPRDNLSGMSEWAVKWLAEHPEWPGVLEL